MAALADGTIDCIGTDHAPHAPQEKEVPIEEALSGSTGLETAFAALHTGLVLTGSCRWAGWWRPCRRRPAGCSACRRRAWRRARPPTSASSTCDESWQVTPATLRGKSRNCAFLGETLTGRVRLTVVDGARRFARARGEA